MQRMKINKVIKKYRKEQNLTQEQIANYLGVTAPAVNKWENGNSYPDITLLAPLARVLKIDIDTLLSFNEELTDTEINGLSIEISNIARDEGVIKAFERGESLIKEYSNCDKLILTIAQILNVFLTIQDIENKEIYESRILQWNELIATSDKPEIASRATASLVSLYTKNKEFKKAQELLDRIPPVGYDKQIMQAILLKSQDKYDETYEIYERMLKKDVTQACSIIQLIVTSLLEEKEYTKAEKYVELGRRVARLFDLGATTENTPELFLAMEKKDTKRSLDVLEKLVYGIETVNDFSKSELYSHMKFNETFNFEAIKAMIKRGLEKDEKADFIREEPRFKMILKSLSCEEN
jgi:putative transcriptional regulator